MGQWFAVVRHGRPHNPREIAYGFLPRVGLTDEGREQARRVASYLRDRGPLPAAMYTSPLLRAVQTARLIAEGMAERATPSGSPATMPSSHIACGTAPRATGDPCPKPAIRLHRSWLLRESGLARYWQGTPWAEMSTRFAEEWRMFQERPALSTAGESLAAQAERMEHLIQRAARRYPDDALVFVSHRDPIVALRLSVEGRSLDALHTTPCHFGSITEFVFSGGKLTVCRYSEP